MGKGSTRRPTTPERALDNIIRVPTLPPRCGQPSRLWVDRICAGPVQRLASRVPTPDGGSRGMCAWCGQKYEVQA